MFPHYWIIGIEQMFVNGDLVVLQEILSESANAPLSDCFLVMEG